MSSLRELQRNWEGLAQSDPLWAICTDPARRNGNWSREEFFATGENELRMVMECLRSLKLDVAFSGAALDFGCGVGRLTRAMAAYFPQCWGVDISPTMVRLAAEFNHDVPQCRFVLNECDDLRQLEDGRFCFVYTSIVLQHIAPRYAAKYLKELPRVLKPGGILVFQLLDEYRASAAARWRQRLGLGRRLRGLTSRGNGKFFMDLHCIPECSVRQLIESAGAQVVNVRLTNSAEPSFDGKLRYLESEPAQGWISKQYCVIKDGASIGSEHSLGA
jgi:SAM-dependent methyltransferase